MFGLILLIMSVIFMVKAADYEHRNCFLWGGLTFLLCFGFDYLIPSLFSVGILLGLVVSFGLMFVANIIQK